MRQIQHLHTVVYTCVCNIHKDCAHVVNSTTLIVLDPCSRASSAASHNYCITGSSTMSRGTSVLPGRAYGLPFILLV